MRKLEIQREQALQARQEFKLIMRLEQAGLLEMPEEEFNRLTTEVESSPLFRKRLLLGQTLLISTLFYLTKEM